MHVEKSPSHPTLPYPLTSMSLQSREEAPLRGRLQYMRISIPKSMRIPLFLMGAVGAGHTAKVESAHLVLVDGKIVEAAFTFTINFKINIRRGLARCLGLKTAMDPSVTTNLAPTLAIARPSRSAQRLVLAGCAWVDWPELTSLPCFLCGASSLSS